MVRLRHPRTYVDTERAYTGASTTLKPTARSCQDCAWPGRCEKDGLCWKAEKAAIVADRLKPSKARWPGRADPRWTRETILDAIVAWDRVHGKPPSRRDWAVMTDHHPGVSTVRRQYGSWLAALQQAGLEPKIGGWDKRRLR